MSAYLIVRAEVDPSVREGFDTWYQNEHLPDAVKAFKALSACLLYTSDAADES